MDNKNWSPPDGSPVRGCAYGVLLGSFIWLLIIWFALAVIF